MKSRKIIEDLFAIAIIAVSVLLVFRGAINPPPSYALYADDMWRSYGFFRRFFVQSINSGVIPWWNPYLFSGMPFMANPSISLFYPPTWIFFLLPVNQAYGVFFAMQIFIALLAMYWFSRRVLGIPFIAGLGASFAWGFSGYFLARTWAGHAETLAASALLPWVFGSFILALKKPAIPSAVNAGFALAVQIFSGYQTVAMFTLEAVGIALIYITIAKKSFIPVITVSVAVISGLLLSALQLLPSMEFFIRSVRTYDFPYGWVAYGSLIPESLTQLFSPFALGNQYNFRGPPPNYPEQAMFIGFTALVFALGAIIHKLLRMTKLPMLFKSPNKKEIQETALVLSLVSIAAFSLWISFGNNAPVDLHRLLWEYIPMYRHIRFPPRHLVLLIFAVSALAGVGIRMIRYQWLQAIAVAILIFELSGPAGQLIEIKKLPETDYDRELINIITPKQVPFRTLQNFGTWIDQRNAFDFDAAMTNGVYSATGYDPSILSSYYRFIDAVNGTTNSSILDHNVQVPYMDVFSPYLDFLNIRYVMVPIGYDPIGGINTTRFTLVKTDTTRQYRLYENRHAMPHFFMVKDMKILPSADKVAEAISKREYNPAETLLVSGTDLKRSDIYYPNCSAADVPIVRFSGYKTNEIILSTESTCNSFLATSEVMYPGWVALLDGNRTEIIANNLAFRAIYIPAGRHVVIMRFIPKIFYIAGTVSLITFAVMLILLGAGRGKRQAIPDKPI
jgi:hypothetical protein